MLYKYKNWISDIACYDDVLEHALSKEKMNKINRLINLTDSKSMLKDLNDNVVELKKLLENLKYDEISLDLEDYGDKDMIIIKYDENIDFCIKNILDLNKKLNLSLDDDYSFYPEIEIDKRYFNKIDFIDGIPHIIRGLGLGKKIYKNLINNYGYISSINIYAEPSIESSRVWHSLSSDDDIYIFSNYDNFIAFWKDFDENEIINILEKYYRYEIDTNAQFDDDFILKYEKLLKKSKILKNIYK